MPDGYWWLRLKPRGGAEEHIREIAAKTSPCYYDGRMLIYRIDATRGGLRAVRAWWEKDAAQGAFFLGDRDVLTEKPAGGADITSGVMASLWRRWCGHSQHPAYLWDEYSGPHDVTSPEEAMTEPETARERVKKALVELGDVDAIVDVMRTGAAAVERLLTEGGDTDDGSGEGVQ